MKSLLLAALLFVPASLIGGEAAPIFTTRFEGVDDPLSENGKWTNQGVDWTPIVKANGIAHGTQTGTNSGIYKYDDSYAHLAGFPPDQEAWGDVRIAKPDASCTQEVEILLRFSSSPHRTSGYECFARCLDGGSSYVQIVRWEGPLGKFTYLADKRGPGYGLKNGDILKASVIGNVITVSINGVEKARATDDTWKSGNPGIGTFLECRGAHGLGSNSDFGFSSFTASAAPQVSLKVEADKVIHTMRGGFGASWHAIEQPIPVEGDRSHGGSAWGANPPAEDAHAWDQICRHADWLGLDFVRVELEQRMFEPERDQFTWDSPEMRILYRILDWCESRRADVFLQCMWGNVAWNAYPEFRGDPVKRVHSGPFSMEAFADGLAVLVKHLLAAKHYTCIRWLCINNEPGYDWSWWQRPPNQPLSLREGVAAVRHALDREGIRVPLSGPDWTDLPELKPEKVDFDEFIGAYDLHSYYAGFDWHPGGGYPLAVAEKRLAAWRQWSTERGKPLFLSELGTMIYGWRGNHAGPSTWEAAIKDAELVVRALNLGVDGFNRWSFVNRGDLDGVWQMIDTWDPQQKALREEILPRPNAYFLYGLISRLAAKHSSVVASDRTGGQLGGLNRVFSAALKSPAGNLSWIIVNDAPQAWAAEFTLQGCPRPALYKYQATAEQKDQPRLQVNPLRTVLISSENARFADRLPPMSLTIFSTWNLKHVDTGIVEDPDR